MLSHSIRRGVQTWLVMSRVRSVTYKYSVSFLVCRLFDLNLECLFNSTGRELHRFEPCGRPTQRVRRLLAPPALIYGEIDKIV
jgi:hypothetical protein